MRSVNHQPIKMGGRSEALCRQTLLVLAQSPHLPPPSFNLPEAVRIRQFSTRVDDTEMALGSDVLSAAIEGHALAKAAGKGVCPARIDGQPLQPSA